MVQALGDLGEITAFPGSLPPDTDSHLAAALTSQHSRGPQESQARPADPLHSTWCLSRQRLPPPRSPLSGGQAACLLEVACWVREGAETKEQSPASPPLCLGAAGQGACPRQLLRDPSEECNAEERGRGAWEWAAAPSEQLKVHTSQGQLTEPRLCSLVLDLCPFGF